jgi:hypothetical protein
MTANIVSFRMLNDSRPDDLRRLVRWATKSDTLRGVLIEMVPDDTIFDEAYLKCNSITDEGMYRQ